MSSFDVFKNRCKTCLDGKLNLCVMAVITHSPSDTKNKDVLCNWPAAQVLIKPFLSHQIFFDCVGYIEKIPKELSCLHNRK